MIATYASAALICAASLLVGRALLALAGRDSWTWLEGAVGLGAILTVTGVVARGPGHGTTATLAAIAIVVGALAVVARRPGRAPAALREGIPVALALALVLSIPFALSGRWGFLGEGFNNDLGLHLAWAEWLRSGFGPGPDPGYPIGPHGLAVAVAAVPGLGLGQAFIGEILAIGVLTGLTALSALGDLAPARRVLAATLVAACYLGASYFAQAAFKEMAEALFVLAFALALRDHGRPAAGRYGRLRLALPLLALAGGIVFSYSFAGLAWPIAVLALWAATVPAVRAALAPRRALRFLARPLTVLAVLVAAGIGVLLVVGPLGFGKGFSAVASSNTYGPVSPAEALGVWWTPNYRLQAVGGIHLAGLAGALGVIALLVGVAWWVGRRDLTVPLALAASIALYLISLPFSGDYSRAKALMIAAPLAMLVSIRPLLIEFPGGRRPGGARRSLPAVAPASPSRSAPRDSSLIRAGWAVLAVAFIGSAAYSSFLALRDAPVGPPGHGSELRAFLPVVHGQPVLYAGQDRYAAYELLGADTHVPLVEFPDAKVDPNPEKPFDTGDAYSPIDFDSFARHTLDRFPYVITGRAAWNSQAPPNFKRIASTPSYVLWENTGPTPEDRQVLLEGTQAGARAGCAAPEIRVLLGEPGRASLFPQTVIGLKARWRGGSILGTGARASQTLRLPPGRWRLSLQYFAPFGLTLSAPGFSSELRAALDGQRPNTISLANNGQSWPAGTYVSRGGPARFTIATAEASWLQSLTGYDGKAYVGDLVAVRSGPHRIVPLSAACGGWIDWYESPATP
jgi:hypothetical protein